MYVPTAVLADERSPVLKNDECLVHLAPSPVHRQQQARPFCFRVMVSSWEAGVTPGCIQPSRLGVSLTGWGMRCLRHPMRNSASVLCGFRSIYSDTGGLDCLVTIMAFRARQKSRFRVRLSPQKAGSSHFHSAVTSRGRLFRFPIASCSIMALERQFSCCLLRLLWWLCCLFKTVTAGAGSDISVTRILSLNNLHTSQQPPYQRSD